MCFNLGDAVLLLSTLIPSNPTSNSFHRRIISFLASVLPDIFSPSGLLYVIGTLLVALEKPSKELLTGYQILDQSSVISNAFNVSQTVVNGLSDNKHCSKYQGENDLWTGVSKNSTICLANSLTIPEKVSLKSNVVPVLSKLGIAVQDNPAQIITFSNKISIAATWKRYLEEDKMRNEFWESRNKIHKTPMLCEWDNLPFYQDQKRGFKIVEYPLDPLNKNDKLKFLLILPLERFEPVQGPRSVSEFEKILQNMEARYLDFCLPAFKKSETVYLNGYLEEILGEKIFPKLQQEALQLMDINVAKDDPKVDFKQMIDFEVSAKGLEPMDNSLVKQLPLFGRSTPNESFLCDEPFDFALYDREKKSLLILGHFASPQQ
ncbi:hypothetical protein Ciccas_012478 [Cichlidogyrus casuarinus]|uniref:Serpin domain-containing protein n=1 Tax=Cichlidogyrus casuarinus TaxID=1844966 RepID=A0ABD2PPH4_9PLAT